MNPKFNHVISRIALPCSIISFRAEQPGEPFTVSAFDAPEYGFNSLIIDEFQYSRFQKTVKEKNE